MDYDDLRTRIARSVGRVCPRWLADQRDDIVQAAMLRLLEIERRGESNPDPPASYLWKVAYSVTIDQIRRIRRRQEVALEQVDTDEPRQASNPGPFEDHALRELGRATLDCLRTLNEPRRLAVGFRLAGHSVAEIARLADWNEKRVRNLLFRGLTDLRRCLAGKGVHP